MGSYARNLALRVLTDDFTEVKDLDWAIHPAGYSYSVSRKNASIWHQFHVAPNVAEAMFYAKRAALREPWHCPIIWVYHHGGAVTRHSIEDFQPIA